MSNETRARPPLHRRRRVWAISFGLWSLPVVVFTVIPVLMQPDTTMHDLFRQFVRQGAVWYLWAIFTPIILWLVHIWPVGPGSYRRNLTRHVLAAVGAGLLFNGVFMALAFLYRPAEWPRDFTLARALVTGFFVWLPFTLMLYTLVGAVGISIEVSKRLRDREVTASRLEARLMEAQLSALRMQLQPHFLFNALNTVAMLVRQGDTRTSVRMLARLSELLRHVLDEAGEPEIPLEQELDVMQRYFEIEQLRFGDRLVTEVDVPLELTRALVPNLLLQPIIENAIRHGVSRRAAAGHIHVSARAVGEQLCIDVLDDGPGLGTSGVAGGSGIGLRNTRARLDHLYGDAASLRIENARPTGVLVRITLPLRTEPSTKPAKIYA